jgi:UDP-N-acetylmuramoyl-L-alanyl-D-glutamate--2,6-diaminopimelate ligase
MTLGDLLGNDETNEVTGFAIDHRKIAVGTVFGAFEGARFNGEHFIAKAVQAGAVAVVARPQALVPDVLHITSDEPRRAFALLAARFYAPYPETVVAVTGTNGKTSTVEITRQLWRMAGHHAASLGTLGVTTADEAVVTGLTSPDIVTFLSTMAGLQREGVTHAAFEASSHGLHQYRSEGLPVKAAAFTNLSRDHLDYHGDMPSYLTAKLRLFSEVVAQDGVAVIYLGDEYADRVVDLARERGLRLMTVGERGQALKLIKRTPTTLGQVLDIEADGKKFKVTLPLIGAYQAANALTAAALVIATGGDTAATLTNLAWVQPVRGRLELACLAKTGAAIYVDYAHTPDALTAALDALRPHTKGRLVLVFGAGGERDVGKRPLMGQAAVNGADVVIVTDDNPRSEDPAAIRAAILSKASNALESGDRRAAIAAAIGMAGADDVVLIAGKGHETGQYVRDHVLPFDDVQVAREEAA